jgi:hypothetical protein
MRSRFGFDAADSSAVKNSGDKQLRPSIDLRIDRLVLAGIPAGDQFRIADAMNRELTRILSEQGLPSTLRNLPAHDRLDGGNVALEHGVSSETTGNLIAQAVYRGISNVESKSRSDSLTRSSDAGHWPKS